MRAQTLRASLNVTFTVSPCSPANYGIHPWHRGTFCIMQIADAGLGLAPEGEARASPDICIAPVPWLSRSRTLCLPQRDDRSEAMSKSIHSLQDLYDLSITRLFLSGPQAILRMVLMQSERDRQAGLNTAGYISGYRGSPVGTVDNQFVAAKSVLEPRNIKFQLGLNEDLAATALWGTQQAEMRGEGKFDGVFGVWYGKGPGVDRSGDVFRHANMAGTSPHGGVVAIAGDDHSGESSTVVHASDVALSDAMMPILSPAGVQEIIDFGLLGFALSRYASVWVGMKCVHDTVESSAVVEAGLDRIQPVIPKDHVLPEGGLHIRPSDDRVPQEARLHEEKIPAVKAFARANAINRIVMQGGKAPKLGIVAAGKAYLDVRQALDDLGIDETQAANSGSGCSSSAWCGRWSRRSSRRLPRGFRRSSWSRRSAR